MKGNPVAELRGILLIEFSTMQRLPAWIAFICLLFPVFAFAQDEAGDARIHHSTTQPYLFELMAGWRINSAADMRRTAQSLKNGVFDSRRPHIVVMYEASH
ncbi:MAG: hypothetical protein O3A78_11640 [Nitrospinae bacterium]|nr:hypothetical protein [Nitrospinota bacterium]MDA1110440.1 hypothetical protein [Nitrospinota bacterium]